MNKHYDGYLCRPKEKYRLEVLNDDPVRYFLEDGNLHWKFDCNSLPPVNSNISVGKPPPKRTIKQDVDFKNILSLFESIGGVPIIYGAVIVTVLILTFR